jgi:hypothetical protein
MKNLIFFILCMGVCLAICKQEVAGQQAPSAAGQPDTSVNQQVAPGAAGQPAPSVNQQVAPGAAGQPAVNVIKGAPSGPQPAINVTGPNIHGTVRYDGAILNGSGFKVTHMGRGSYMVSWANALNAQAPTCLVTLTTITQPNYPHPATTCVVSGSARTDLYITCWEQFVIVTSGPPGQQGKWGVVTNPTDESFGFMCVSN